LLADVASHLPILTTKPLRIGLRFVPYLLMIRKQTKRSNKIQELPNVLVNQVPVSPLHTHPIHHSVKRLLKFWVIETKWSPNYVGGIMIRGQPGAKRGEKSGEHS
jgi:hypothetical protein